MKRTYIRQEQYTLIKASKSHRNQSINLHCYQLNSLQMMQTLITDVLQKQNECKIKIMSRVLMENTIQSKQTVTKLVSSI